MKNYIKYPLILGSTFTIGSVFGILIAPDSGKNTCKKIINGVCGSKKFEIDNYLDNRINAISEEINIGKNEIIEKKVYAHINRKLNNLLKLCKRYKKDFYEEKIYVLKNKIDSINN